MAKIALKLLPFVFCLSACNSSVTPSFLKESTASAVKDICLKEYKLDLVTKLVDQTLWVYMPLEDIVTKLDKPEKYIERFSIQDNKNLLAEGILSVSYLIKPIEEKESNQEMALDKKVNEKIFNVLQVIRRVLFSTDHSKINSPLFFCIVTADIKNGFQIKQVFHLSDLKKLSYGFISQTEYQHRILQDTEVSPLIIGDRQGTHLDYQNITLDNFIVGQIQNRIKIKFQKPEVEKNADVDKEILKIITYTLNTYNFQNFTLLEMTNLLNEKKSIFNRTAILNNPQD